LLAHILPSFTKETGITVHVLAQGTGQALQTAARDDADLVRVHDPEAEQKFIAAGDGIDRQQIAWNGFIVVGPRADPAHIAGTHDAVAALKLIGSAQAPFVSRSDKSGTDALEHRLWHAAEIDPAKAPSAPKPGVDHPREWSTTLQSGGLRQPSQNDRQGEKSSGLLRSCQADGADRFRISPTLLFPSATIQHPHFISQI
jgi:hypothetical protein